MIRALKSLLAATVLIAIWAVPAMAGDTKVFGASPTGGRSAIGVPESGTLRDTIEVRNHTTRAITLTLYAASATIGRDGVVAIGFKGSATSGLSSRLRITSSVRVPAKAVRVVGVSAPVDGLPESLRTGAIVVEAGESKGTGSLDLVERIAILVRPGAPVAAGTSIGGASRPSSKPWIVASILPLLAGGWWFLFFKRRRKDDEEAPKRTAEAAGGRSTAGSAGGSVGGSVGAEQTWSRSDPTPSRTVAVLDDYRRAG